MVQNDTRKKLAFFVRFCPVPLQLIFSNFSNVWIITVNALLLMMELNDSLFSPEHLNCLLVRLFPFCVPHAPCPWQWHKVAVLIQLDEISLDQGTHHCRALTQKRQLRRKVYFLNCARLSHTLPPAWIEQIASKIRIFKGCLWLNIIFYSHYIVV
jgi:hypothetical protein